MRADRGVVGRRAWVVWGVGVAAYAVAVLQRTSFGVAGLDAAERYHASASALAGFAVLQLLVYAALQVPVGVALDRFGPRRVVVVGALTMASGQAVLALSTTVAVAVAGRALVGAGDAMTFISVLRLVVAWFPPRRVPLVTQLTGLTGQVGQVLSAFPLAALLHLAGWVPAFASAAGLSLVVAVVGAAALRDGPSPWTGAQRAPSLRDVGRDLASAWRHPGTRLGLWSHFTTLFSGTMFALMWGFPFLVSGEGLARVTASALLTMLVVVGVVGGPLIGVLVERHPLRRSWLVLGITGLTALVWGVVLAVPGPAPLWLLAALMVVIGVGGPGSMIGFDFARTFNPPNRIGTATGIVNVGGFVSALLAILVVGVVLDVRTGGAATYALDDYRVALSGQYLLWGIGVAGVLVTRRKVRRRMAQQGVVVPPLRQALARSRQTRRAARDRRA